MTFAICLGTYRLLDFARLNLTYLRKVFGEIPIALNDGRSDNSPAMEQLAHEFECVYLGERVNRSHFAGDIQTAVTAVAFAQANKCDIAIKLNQRTILLDPHLPTQLKEAFRDKSISLVTPGQYPKESIVERESQFHALFPFGIDVLAFRAKEWSAQDIADRYALQWQTGKGRYDAHSEEFWRRQSERIGKAHLKAPWITTGTGYLRKIQHRAEDYQRAARAVGIDGEFKTAEWSQIDRANYRPEPRA